MKQEEIDKLVISKLFKISEEELKTIFDSNEFLFDTKDEDYTYLKKTFESNYIKNQDEYIDGVKRNFIFKIDEKSYVLLHRARPIRLWETDYGDNKKKRCVLISKNVVLVEEGDPLYRKILPFIRKEKIETLVENF